MTIVPASFYRQDSLTVARQIIGKLLVRDLGSIQLIGRIVETEAYNQEDPASHSYRGLTRRTAPMFEAGGISYVYFIYGMYDCFNVVTDRAGYGSAVLIRAVEPLAGLHIMWRNRFPGQDLPDIPDSLGPEERSIAEESRILRLIRPLANGPGKLARAFAISTERDSGQRLDRGNITVRDDGFVSGIVEKDVRIGISVATEHEWRFFLAESPFVSRGQGSSSSIRRSRSSSEK
jgi:DNA-3-methyladenine glycosylase